MRCRRQSDQHDPLLDSRRVSGDTVILSMRGALDLACLEVDLPGMQRADDRRAGDDAVAQRATFVRTLVVSGEELVACPGLGRGPRLKSAISRSPISTARPRGAARSPSA